MAYEHPKHPYRPALFEGDYPPPTETFAEIKAKSEEQYRLETEEAHRNQNFEFARREREELLREQQSGYLAQNSWIRNDGPLSPREQQQVTEKEAKGRELRYGLPDSPEDMPAVAVRGGLPVRFR